MSTKYFVGWLLEREQRDVLLKDITPHYADVIADHVTLVGRANSEIRKPKAVTAEIVGTTDDGEGLQALVVEIDGTTKRPDGGVFHVTWSLDRKLGRKPVDSYEVLARLG